VLFRSRVQRRRHSSPGRCVAPPVGAQITAGSWDNCSTPTASRPTPHVSSSRTPLMLALRPRRCVHSFQNLKSQPAAALTPRRHSRLYLHSPPPQAALAQQWVAASDGVKQQIRGSLLTTLGSAAPDVRHTAALVIAKLAAVEIPRSVWPAHHSLACFHRVGPGLGPWPSARHPAGTRLRLRRTGLF